MALALARQDSCSRSFGHGAVGREGEILVQVEMHSLLLTAAMGLLALLQAYVLAWTVPEL